ncbi:MAG: GNAT family N-acetyltransferase [Ktedonobacteraceae bacterium]
MQFIFTLMEEADAHEINTWRYAEPYAVYNIDAAAEDDPAELLDRRSPYYAVCDETGALVGYFCYGTSAQVWQSETPGLYSEDATIDIGLGMRPDLTGKGLGLTWVNAGLDFARENFQPRTFRLVVLTFNERAIRVYERAGFARVRVFTQKNIYGERDFLEMKREAGM